MFVLNYFLFISRSLEKDLKPEIHLNNCYSYYRNHVKQNLPYLLDCGSKLCDFITFLRQFPH